MRSRKTKAVAVAPEAPATPETTAAAETTPAADPEPVSDAYVPMSEWIDEVDGR